MATVDIKINNKTYSGVSSVNLPLADGSGYAPFNLDSSHIIAKCSIIYDLTDVTSSNKATSIASGSSFETTLSTSLEGRIVSGVVVTMGGTTLSGVYDSSTGVISISEVTDDISITATTADKPLEALYRGENLVFDGTASSVIDTGLKLCDTDKDFTIIVQLDTPVNVTGDQLLNCCAGSKGTDGYYLKVTSATNLTYGAFDKGAGVSFSSYYNTTNGAVQVYTLRHQANSGTVESRAKISSADGDLSKASVSNKSCDITFASHEQTLILGARRWNGINGFANTPVKSIEVFDVYLSDDQLASYYE